MTLPLQKLPFLVIQIIFQATGFLELFLLSCTSAKTKRIIRSAYKIRSYQLTLAVENPLLLQIHSETDMDYMELIYLHSKEKQVGNVIHVKIGTDNVSSRYIGGGDHTISLLTYWSDPKTGFNIIYDALFEVFGETVKEVTMDVNKIPAENYRNEYDWIEQQFPNLHTFEISGSCSPQDYIWLMKNVRAKNAVFITIKPTENPENHEIVNLEMEEVYIRYGSWMKLQDIYAIKARKIVLRNVSLTDNEINMLLKNLEAFKEKSNLKELLLKFDRDADTDIVLDGLNVINENQMKPENSINQWSFELANGDKCTVVYGAFENNQADDLEMGFEIQIGN